MRAITIPIVIFLSIAIFFSSSAIVKINNIEVYEKEYNICEDGLSFIKLEVFPVFDSQEQMDLYLSEYNNQLDYCNYLMLHGPVPDGYDETKYHKTGELVKN